MNIKSLQRVGGLALVIGLTAVLAACKDAEQVFPDGAKYEALTVAFFTGTGNYTDLEFLFDQFTCIDGFVYDRADTSTTINDAGGNPITCDGILDYRVTITKVKP